MAKQDELDSVNKCFEDIKSICEEFPDEVDGNVQLSQGNDEVNQKYADLKKQAENMNEHLQDDKKIHQDYADHQEKVEEVLLHVESVCEQNSHIELDVDEAENDLNRIKVTISVPDFMFFLRLS